MTTRMEEEFEELLRHDFSDDDMRIQSARMLQDWSDPERANKVRQDIYNQKRRSIERMTIRSGTADLMEKLRATKGDYRADAREFALSDNIAEMYFNFFGENFEGGDVMDNSDEPYTCPWCKLKYGMSLKNMPDNCLRCGSLTPLGRLRKEGAFNR